MRCLLYIRKKEPRHTATAFYIRRWIGEEGCGKGFLTRYIMTVVTVGPIVTACAGRRVALHLRCGLIYALHCTFWTHDLEMWRSVLGSTLRWQAKGCPIRWRLARVTNCPLTPCPKGRGQKQRQALGASCSNGNMSDTKTWSNPNESKRYYGRQNGWTITSNKRTRRGLLFWPCACTSRKCTRVSTLDCALHCTRFWCLPYAV